MRTRGNQVAFELTLSMRAKELDACLNTISQASDKGETDCFLKCGGGMICKETVEALTESYGFELLITIHDKFNTFVKCYFGDTADGSISIERMSGKPEKAEVNELYENIEKYFWSCKVKERI